MNDESTLRGIIFFLILLCMFSVGTTLWVLKTQKEESARVVAMLEKATQTKPLSETPDLGVETKESAATSSIPKTTVPQIPTSTGKTPAPTESLLTSADVAKHKGVDSCWIIISGKIYDVTRFIKSHPGGRTQFSCSVERTRPKPTRQKEETPEDRTPQ